MDVNIPTYELNPNHTYWVECIIQKSVQHIVLLTSSLVSFVYTKQVFLNTYKLSKAGLKHNLKLLKKTLPRFQYFSFFECCPQQNSIGIIKFSSQITSIAVCWILRIIDYLLQKLVIYLMLFVFVTCNRGILSPNLHHLLKTVKTYFI